MYCLAEVQEIQKLLLNPNPANVAAAQSRLDAVSEELSGLVRAAAAGEVNELTLLPAMRQLRLDLSRIARLLENGAKFFNSISGLRNTATYQRNGCLATQPNASLRTLARL